MRYTCSHHIQLRSNCGAGTYIAGGAGILLLPSYIPLPIPVHTHTYPTSIQTSRHACVSVQYPHHVQFKYANDADAKVVEIIMI